MLLCPDGAPSMQHRLLEVQGGMCTRASAPCFGPAPHISHPTVCHISVLAGQGHCRSSKPSAASISAQPKSSCSALSTIGRHLAVPAGPCLRGGPAAGQQALRSSTQTQRPYRVRLGRSASMCWHQDVLHPKGWAMWQWMRGTESFEVVSLHLPAPNLILQLLVR